MFVFFPVLYTQKGENQEDEDIMKQNKKSSKMGDKKLEKA